MLTSIRKQPNQLLIEIVVLAATSLPYFIHLGTSSLWDANEAFYAETPREMMESGNYLVPQFNYQPRLQKPPLTYWVVLLSYRAFGVSELSVRIPGAAAAIGTVIFTFLIGRALFNRRAGLMAAVVLGTALRVFILARRLPIDILLLFCLTGTAYFLVRAIQKNSRASWALTYVFASLGFLTKGPVAWVFPVLTYLIWSLWNRRFSFTGTRPIMGTLILTMLVVPWYVAIYAGQGWTYIGSFFLRDNLARFASESYGPARGPFYYVIAYLADFFPWSLLSLFALGTLLAGRRGAVMKDLSYGLPLVWSGTVFLFFSLAKNKQEYYIAPMFPMMAVILSGVLERTLLARPEVAPDHTKPFWSWGFLAVAISLSALAVPLFLAIRSIIPGVPVVLHYAPSAVLLAASAALAWNVVRRRISRGFCALAFTIWLLIGFAASVYLPVVEPLRPVKELCTVIGSRSKPGDQIGYYRATVPSMVFYLRRPIFEEFDANAMARRFQSAARVFCILTERDYTQFVGERDLILYILGRRPRLATQLRYLWNEESWSEQELILVSNRPETGPMERRGVP